MALLDKIKRILLPNTIRETEAAEAYDLWAQTYDSQPDNLILALDEQLFSKLLGNTNLKGKVVADVGCGTGRHWGKISKQEPKQVYGYDVSIEMLHKLQLKYPDANVSQLSSNKLSNLANESCDVIISTLAIAHIDNIEEAITEWNRVLKRTGEMLLTDYHPSNLAQGGQRTFSYGGKTVAVKNYIHSIDTIKEILSRLHLRILYFEEIVIDDRLKHYYTKQNALHVYEKHKGSAIIYGMHIKKEDAAS